MKQKYLLIDGLNMFHRMRHMASKQSTAEEKVATTLHLIFASANKVARKFGPDCHAVFLEDGHSWRKEFYKPYKANRVVQQQDLTDSEIAESKLFWETYQALSEYLRNKTNMSVIREPNSEADDLMARFIHLHPNDTHYIISSDSDYLQLIAPNVFQYNGVTDQYITLQGYHDHKYNLIVDKKTKEPKLLGDPQFVLFEKITRGDSTDNVFSAYPGVRTNGTKNKIGLREAYADKNKQGFAHNNFMLQRWLDHNNVEHIVKDDFERNRTLIDLTAQPQSIKDACDLAIITGVRTAHVPNVGIHFLRFCGRHDLKRISDSPDQYISWLNREYQGELRDVISGEKE